ncbi:nuclease-related domain-containing protein [Desulfurivibrio sp. D14AmB]|uniref:nuclease-related domain-containing protein n=1 Tax=Desulfurivibrio sp. D14AmB TaxID=3374370 RepID=UPI00376EB949
MADYLVQFLPVVVIAVFFGLLLVLFVITKKWHQRGRRNPLTRDLLRNPGESLREQVEDLSFDLVSHISMLVFFPFVWGTQLLIQYFLLQKGPTFGTLLLNVLTLLGFMIYFCVQIVRIWRKRHNLRLGFECEMAVGQELNQLMLHGCRVYHDVPGEGFNIDHVVVSPAGVYAVETKGRAKPDKGRGAEDVRVVYDGKSLRFPDWTETEPIAQAKRQANWLANWLRSAVGKPIAVLPALALPGWYIERQERDMVVFNSKNPAFLAKPRGERVLSDELIEQVGFQVEQRCRTVEPISYNKKKK